MGMFCVCVLLCIESVLSSGDVNRIVLDASYGKGNTLRLRPTTSGLNACFTEEACASGSTLLNLVECGIGEEYISELAECFDDIGRSTIREMHLDFNQLTTLPVGIFDGFEALEELYLGNNGIVLSAGMFDGLISLRYLHLNNNLLSTLPSGVFDDLEALVQLYIRSNEFSTLPAGIFDGLVSLETLRINDNPDLQCIPSTIATNDVNVISDTFVGDGTCECPDDPICDEEGLPCDCQVGEDGYSCESGESSSDLMPAFSCPSSVPSPVSPATTAPHTTPTPQAMPATPAPEATPAPLVNPLPSALVDARERTTVVTEAGAFDERTSGYGCSPDGCTAENTRDDNLDANSRWSCKGDLLEGDGGCCIEYAFEDPQDIVAMNIAFYKGAERTRTLNVYDNGEFYRQIESSGLTTEYEEFGLSTEDTAGVTLCLDDYEDNADQWLSITEVQFMVL